MGERWTPERVMAAAPDAASAVAARKLAGPGPWSDVGHDGPVIWGHFRGSAREAYRVVVDTDAPRYQCSCPSRKFPCKHVLGLLFRWVERRFPDDGRTPRAGATAVASASQPVAESVSAPDPAKAAAAEARAAERDARAATGLEELRQWLNDRVSDGLGRLAGHPELWEQMAARMIDAQVPGAARRLRALAELPSGDDDWAPTVLAELALLDLLARAFEGRASLDAALLATVRAHLGFTVPKAEVLRSPPVADRWAVIGLHDTQDDERVATRRVWLFGRDTGRFAVVLLFSINGAPYEMPITPGMELDADLHFYPGQPPLRALIGNRRDEHPRVRDLVPGDPTTDGRAEALGGTVARARDAWAASLSADPWLTVWPVAVRGRIGTRVHPPTEADASPPSVEFALADAAGDRVRVCGPASVVWQAVAVSGGADATWFGELRPDGFNPLALAEASLTRGELIVL